MKHYRLFAVMCLLSVVSARMFTVEDPAVTNFREYLRIPSIHPNEEAYQQCVEWLRLQANEIGLDFHYLDLPGPATFAVWMTWNGSDLNLKSILLNSHMDVVPVDTEKWIHPPFNAHKDDDGNIYARGASDMKSTTVAEIEALRRLKASNFQPLRTIHLSVLPGEEVGGHPGMEAFVKTEQFASLNVGLSLDEGIPSSKVNRLTITYGEKTLWQFNITAKGESSHASSIPQYTAAQRLHIAVDKLLKYRESEYNKLQSPNITIENITALNLVSLGGGIGNNVIPNVVWAAFDMRILIRPGWNFTDVEQMLFNITEAAQLGPIPNEVKVKFIKKSMETGQTAINESNIWWTKLQETCAELDLECEPHILQAVTDARFLRDIGIPALGVNPFLNSAGMAHADNEFINEFEFLRGIDRYKVFIHNFAMMPDNSSYVKNK